MNGAVAGAYDNEGDGSGHVGWLFKTPGVADQKPQFPAQNAWNPRGWTYDTRAGASGLSTWQAGGTTGYTSFEKAWGDARFKPTFNMYYLRPRQVIVWTPHYMSQQ